MKAEETLQFMADFWDDMFPTRKHCLNHLFCAIGNGFEWKDGELVEVCGDMPTDRYKLIVPIEKAVFSHEEFWKQAAEKDKLICKATGKKPNPDYDFRWSNLSRKYSYLFDYPEDIKPDWLALINECKQMLIADDIDVDNIED